MVTMILLKVYYRNQVAALGRVKCYRAALLLAECYSTITAVLFDAKPCERAAAIDSVERANLGVIEKGYYCGWSMFGLLSFFCNEILLFGPILLLNQRLLLVSLWVV